MSKGITQRQWLNIVIIILSGLILVFMLLGRFMDQAVDESNARASTRVAAQKQIAQQLLQLRMIDFGFQRIILIQSEWHVEPKSSLSKKPLKNSLPGGRKS